MSSHLDSLVSLKRISRTGGVSWIACILETSDGRVRVRRIGSDVIECDVTPSLMRTLMARGYVIHGARKIWRLTIEELATLAGAVLFERGIGQAADDAQALEIKNSLLAALCALSQSNVAAWAASFDLELGDVEDLVPTPDELGRRMGTLPLDCARARRVLELIESNVPDGTAWVRHGGWRELLVGPPESVSARSNRSRANHASRPAIERRGAA